MLLEFHLEQRLQLESIQSLEDTDPAINYVPCYEPYQRIVYFPITISGLKYNLYIFHM